MKTRPYEPLLVKYKPIYDGIASRANGVIHDNKVGGVGWVTARKNIRPVSDETPIQF